MEPRDDALGATWLAERYQVAGLRARGALSAVYQGQDAILQRPVAIKAPQLADEAMYRSTLDLTANLAHPAFLALYDTIEQDGRLYLAYEFVEGRPLSDYITAGLPVRRALAILVQVTRALAYAHSHGVTHGDLTPASILVDRAAMARVANTGVAPDGVYFDETAASAFASGIADDPDTTASVLSENMERFDCWASAALLWQLLTDPVAKTETGEPTRDWRPDTPDSLRTLLEQALRLTDSAAITTVAALEEGLAGIERALGAPPDADAQELPPTISALRAARDQRAIAATGRGTETVSGPTSSLSSRWRRLGGVSPTATTDYGALTEDDEAATDPRSTQPVDDGATHPHDVDEPYVARAPRLILPARSSNAGSQDARTLVSDVHTSERSAPTTHPVRLGAWVWALLSLAVFALCYLAGFFLAPLASFVRLP